LKKSPLEIFVFTISIILIFLTIGLFIYDGIISRHERVKVAVMIDLKHVEKNAGGYSVDLALSNKGNTSVQSLWVRFYNVEKNITETSEVIVPFLPRGSKRYASVTFKQKPKKVTYKIISYLLP
jgi:uncharacterized protein (TIGR02588 family)